MHFYISSVSIILRIQTILHTYDLYIYISSFGQILFDLHIITEERIILQFYEITQMFVDFLQRYDNMSKDIYKSCVF
jgi:hypothetical protein